MDEAFYPLSRVIEELSAFPKDTRDPANISRMVIAAFEIETSIELDVTRDTTGGLELGTVPPLYRVDTSLRPYYHSIRFLVQLDEAPGATLSESEMQP